MRGRERGRRTHQLILKKKIQTGTKQIILSILFNIYVNKYKLLSRGLMVWWLEESETEKPNGGERKRVTSTELKKKFQTGTKQIILVILF